MKLSSYIKKFGQFTFEEKPFNHVDATILATAVYSNFEVVAPSIHDGINKGIPFNRISRYDLQVVVAGQTLVLQNKKMIPLMVNSKRFGSVVIKYVCKKFDADSANQFYACTFEIPGVGHYIALRGTDISVAGWKENLDLSTSEKIKSQVDSLEYVNFVARITKGPLYIGGHSKGGNHALFASIYCDQIVKDRLVNIYSFDGNGLADKSYYSSPEYNQIKSRIVFIKPFDSVVGELMYTPKEFLTVKSSSFGVFQHNTHYWKINRTTGDFIYTKTNNKQSLIRHWTLKEWLKLIDNEEKTNLVNFIIAMLGGCHRTIYDFLFSFNKLRTFYRVTRTFSKDQRKSMKKSVKLYFKCYKNAKARYKVDGKLKQGIHIFAKKNFIFDVDGTLVDSYRVIIGNVMIANDHFGIDDSYKHIYEFIMKSTTTEYINNACLKHNILCDEYFKYYESLPPHLEVITLMPEVKNTLEVLYSHGLNMYIYTHRGKSLECVLENLDIKKYFVDIVDSTAGLKRKPSGEGISYIVKKHNLSRRHTYYVGDREIDILAARDAGVKSVLYKSSGVEYKNPADIEINSFSQLLRL